MGIQNASFTLDAAVDTELLGAAGLDISGLAAVGITVTNAGDDNSLTGLAAYVTDDLTGTRWAPVALVALPADLAPGESIEVGLADLATGRLRLVATSTLGTDLVLDMTLHPAARGPV